MLITYDSHDDLVDRMAKCGYSNKLWYPTVTEIQEEIEPYLDNPIYMHLLIYFDELSNPERTEENLKAKKYISQLLREHEIFLDEEDTRHLAAQMKCANNMLELNNKFNNYAREEQMQLIKECFEK